VPKLKSHRGAKKRYKLTATGKVKHKRAYLRHLLANKNKQQKRALKKANYLQPGDAKHIRPMISI